MKKLAIRFTYLISGLILTLHLFGGMALAAPGDITIGSPPSNPLPGSNFTVPVTIETSVGVPLGAYDLTVNYKASVLNIVSIAGGSAPEFSGAPVSNPLSYTTGITDFNAVNLTSSTTPDGVVNVANVTFNVVGSAGETSTLSLDVNGIVDTDGFPISPTNTINGFVIVGTPPPTGFNFLWLILIGLLGVSGGLGIFRAGGTFILRNSRLFAITFIVPKVFRLSKMTYCSTRSLINWVGNLVVEELNKRPGRHYTIRLRTGFLNTLATLPKLVNLLFRRQPINLRLVLFFLPLCVGGFLILSGKVFSEAKTELLFILASLLLAIGFYFWNEKRFALAYLAVMTITLAFSILSVIPSNGEKIWSLLGALGLIAFGLTLRGRPSGSSFGLIRLPNLALIKKVVASILVLSMTTNSAVLYLSVKTMAYLFWVLVCLGVTLYLAKRKSLNGRGLTHLPLTLIAAVFLALSLAGQPALASGIWLPGDVNGDGLVNQADADLLSRYLVGLERELPNPLAADVNGDGQNTVADLFTIKAALAGLTLPLSEKPHANLFVITSLGGNLWQIQGLPGAAPPSLDTIRVHDRTTGQTEQAPVQPDGSFQLQLLSDPGRQLAVHGFSGPNHTTGILISNPVTGTTPSTNDLTNTGPPTKPPEGGGDCGCDGKKKDGGITDPVALYNGEFELEATDLHIKARGTDFSFSRIYKSRIDYDGPLGHNWDFNYNKKLTKADPFSPSSDIVNFNGHARGDVYTFVGPGSYTSPTGFFTRLSENPGGTYALQHRDGSREFYLGFNGSPSQGKLVGLIDKAGNQIRFLYDAGGKLITIIDTLGRKINLTYNGSGRISGITDFTGRTVTYDYNGAGDLVAVTSPAVTGTPNGNNFPSGKTTEYTYSAGAGVLDHNLETVTKPNEVAGGPFYLKNYYDGSDKVYKQDWGGTNSSGIAAGGALTLSYASLETTVTDRAGNVIKFNFSGLGQMIREEKFTRGIRPGDPASFVTTYEYDAEGRRTKVTHPEGDSVEYTYDFANPYRMHQNNLLQEKKLPGPRGGAQTAITTTYSYEPVYNQMRTLTDPRGNDPAFSPPITPPGQSAARYTTTNVFDYQEGANLAAIAYAMGLSPAAASAELAAAGVSLSLGDINSDGNTGQTQGNVIEARRPTVNLPSGSSLIPIEGDTTQEIVTDYVYNNYDQLIKEIDPEGNVAVNTYNPLYDPDGDGVATAGYRYGRWYRYAPWGGTTGGGYLTTTTSDSATSARRREAAAPVAAGRSYVYDQRGNVLSATDPNGNTRTHTYNQLDQLVREQAPAPFLYYTDHYYDANDNQTKVNIQNVTVSGAGLNEVVAANSELSTIYTYDILDNLLTQTEEVSAGEVGPAEAVTTTYRYDANGNRTKVIQPEVNETRITFDERNLPYETIRGFGLLEAATTTVDYDKNGNIKTTKDAQDNNGDGLPETTEYSYDGYDRLIQTKDAAGGIGDTLYDPVGNVLRNRGNGQPSGPTPLDNSGAGNKLLAQQEYRHDELNRRYEERDVLFDTPGGAPKPESPLITKHEYDRAGREVRIIQPKGNAATQTYDGLNRVVATTDALGNTISNTYNKNGNLIRAVETDKGAGLPDENFTTGYQYDALNRLIRTTDNLGNTRRFYYDSRDNQVWTSDGNGPAMADPSGEFPYPTTPPGYTTINDDGNTTRFTYDGLSREVKTEQHQRLGGAGNGGLDPAGNLDLTNPENTDGVITTAKDFDGNGRLVAESDDENKTTSYAYDFLDRLKTKTNPDLTLESYEYDNDSHLTKRTDENVTVIDFSYDALDRRTGETAVLAVLPSVGGTTVEIFQYDGVGRLTRATENNDPLSAADNSTETFSYDSVSRVLVENQNGKETTGTYDGNDNRTNLKYPDGRLTSFEYDSLDRLDILNDGPDSSYLNIADYDYLGRGRVAQRSNLNGTKLTMLNDAATADIGYDGLRRTVKQRNMAPGGAVIAGHDYAYDRENNKRFEKRLQGDMTADIFSYDSAYQLTGSARNASDPLDPGTAAFSDSYTYDGVGNRMSSTEDSISRSYVHDWKNQYIDVSGVGMGLDSKGNIADDGTNLYKYDYKDRLIQVNKKSDGSLVAKYAYDSQNRRIRKETATDVTNFYWDGWQIAEERNAAGAVIGQYTYGNGIDEPLTMNRGGSTYYYHQNQLGNVVAITNAAGAVVEAYRYPAYGKPLILTGPGVDGVWFTADDVASPTSAIDNRYMFTGREYDSETGFYYYRNRYYNPTTGRFLTRDPLGFVDGMNLYEYVGGNTVNLIDPTGNGLFTGVCCAVLCPVICAPTAVAGQVVYAVCVGVCLEICKDSIDRLDSFIAELDKWQKEYRENTDRLVIEIEKIRQKWEEEKKAKEEEEQRRKEEEEQKRLEESRKRSEEEWKKAQEERKRKAEELREEEKRRREEAAERLRKFREEPMPKGSVPVPSQPPWKPYRLRPRPVPMPTPIWPPEGKGPRPVPMPTPIWPPEGKGPRPVPMPTPIWPED